MACPPSSAASSAQAQCLVEDEAVRFRAELQWCIHQLELGLQRQSPDSKQAMDTIKIIKILQSNKAPIVKKRQAMRNALGDYRKKMKEAEKKSINGMRHSKFQSTPSKVHKKSRFIRQSIRNTSGLLEDSSERPDLSSDMNHLHIQASTDSSIHNSIFSTERLDTHSGPSCSNGESESVPSMVQDRFHFIPSDNAFCFSFDAPPRDDALCAGDLAESGDSGGDKRIDSVPCGQSKNFFKLEKSDNNFSFNFETD